MPRRFVCPKGHIWYAELPVPVGDSTQVLPSCSTCGEAGNQYPGRLSGSEQLQDATSHLDSDDLSVSFELSHALRNRPPDLPGYELGAEIGRGGMGVVYDAIDLTHQGRVAVKHLPRLDPSKILRFKREFRALSGLSHPNLSGMYELAHVNGQWFLVMERVEGQCFVDHFLNIPDMTERIRQLRPALIQLAEGLHHLHQAGLMHCDIKPSNVLISREGRVVLLDFGLVTEWFPTDADAIYELVGSIGYLAPERFAGQPASKASDWYAVGIVIYESLVGKRPFHGTRTKLIWQQRYMEPPEPIETNPNVPNDWNDLCLALIGRDPDRRPNGPELLRRLRGMPETVQDPVSLLPRQAPLIGRDRQLAAIQDAFQRSREGRTVIVHVRGQAGMGKTALVERFLERLAARESVTILRGRCYQQESVPFEGLDGLIDSLSQLLVAMPHEELSAVLPSDIGALCRAFPVLRRIKEAAKAEVSSVAEAVKLLRRAVAALRELFANLARTQPLILWLDDLQWGDVDSARMLGEVIRPPDAPPLLLIAGSRTESDDLFHSTLCKAVANAPDKLPLIEVTVDALTQMEASSLAMTLLAETATAGEAVADLIAKTSQGWPVSVIEQARHFQQTTARERHAPDPAALTLARVLEARMRKLPDSAVRLLEVVTVAGQPMPLGLARTAADSEPRPIPAAKRGRPSRPFEPPISSRNIAKTAITPSNVLTPACGNRCWN
jgi:hypothetical protein